VRQSRRGARPRQAALGAARRLGLEDQLRRVQRTLEPASTKRNRRDDENLRVVMAAVLARDSCCVDVGANVGTVLADMVALAPDGKHIAYEPLPELHADLARRFPGVDVRAAALSDHAGEASFTRVVDAPAQSGFRPIGTTPRATERLTVPVERLDDALPEGFVPALVKIDVEGAEEEVLRGALDTIRRHQPVVVLEHGNSAADYGTRPDDVFELLCGAAGLRIFDMDGAGPLTLERFRALASPPAATRWNFFARP
jgi:FkbM family methyltransferase